jgi:lysophospholipase L1-like esterase
MKYQVVTWLAVSSLMMMAPAWGEGGESMKTKQGGSRTIVVIGASYAGGWKPERPIAGHQIITKGVSGEESSQVLARFDVDATSENPDAVIIWGFINDIFRVDRSRLTERLQRTRSDLLSMVKLAREARIVPILATEVTIRGKHGIVEAATALTGRILGKESYQKFINRQVREMNNWIRVTAQHDEILLLDFEAVLADNSGLRRKEFSKPDGSHISPGGYDALTKYADEQLSNLLPAL